MFGPRLKLFTIAGFRVYADASWILIFMLVAWSLSRVFPAALPELSTRATWVMGVTGALGLFLSIVAHELAHSLMARRLGTEIRSITLFLFGGVAEMSEEPRQAADEFKIAVVGPLTSLGVAALAFGLALLLARTTGAAEPVAVLEYLASINVLLAVFNLIPAFPLDGGRVLRSFLWRRHGDLKRATATTARLGQTFGVVLIVFGVIGILGGNFIGGMWYALIGLFLRGAAQQSYSAVVTRIALEGEPVRRFMQKSIVVVPPEMTLARFVDEVLYPSGHKLFPVVVDERVLGVMTTQRLKDVPRDRWDATVISEAMAPLDDEIAIRPDTDAVDAMARMNKSGRSRFVVTDAEGRLAGVLTLKDLLAFLELKVELAEDDEARRRRGPPALRPQAAR